MAKDANWIHIPEVGFHRDVNSKIVRIRDKSFVAIPYNLVPANVFPENPTLQRYNTLVADVKAIPPLEGSVDPGVEVNAIAKNPMGDQISSAKYLVRYAYPMSKRLAQRNARILQRNIDSVVQQLDIGFPCEIQTKDKHGQESQLPILRPTRDGKVMYIFVRKPDI